jgi:hypothetical protein
MPGDWYWLVSGLFLNLSGYFLIINGERIRRRAVATTGALLGIAGGVFAGFAFFPVSLMTAAAFVAFGIIMVGGHWFGARMHFAR